MADQPPSRGRAGAGKSDGPRRDRASGGRPERGRPERGPAASKGAPRGGDKRGGDKRGGPAKDRPYSRDRKDRRDRRDDVPRTVDQQEYDGPDLPAEVTGRELDRSVAAQLASLPEKLAQRVARHLVAAGLLLESDPETAYKHTLAARARAGRLAVVREAVGEAAYSAGKFSEALAELRAARRMNGAKEYIAMMADCERALGRPDRALTLVRNVTKEGLPAELQAELTIVEAGARRDRSEIDAALRTLEHAPLTSKTRAPWVARLRYAYADTLVAAGRRQEALTWFHRVVAIDSDELTDAAERAEELERALDS